MKTKVDSKSNNNSPDFRGYLSINEISCCLVSLDLKSESTVYPL